MPRDGQVVHAHFSTLLVDLRQRIELSQTKLAEVSGVNHGYISEIESGLKLPTEDVVKRLADGLREHCKRTDTHAHLKLYDGDVGYLQRMMMAMYDDRIEACRREMAQYKTLRRDWE